MGSVQEAEPELEPWYVQGVGIRVLEYVCFSLFSDTGEMKWSQWFTSGDGLHTQVEEVNFKLIS